MSFPIQLDDPPAIDAQDSWDAPNVGQSPDSNASDSGLALLDGKFPDFNVLNQLPTVYPCLSLFRQALEWNRTPHLVRVLVWL